MEIHHDRSNMFYQGASPQTEVPDYLYNARKYGAVTIVVAGNQSVPEDRLLPFVSTTTVSSAGKVLDCALFD